MEVANGSAIHNQRSRCLIRTSFEDHRAVEQIHHRHLRTAHYWPGSRRCKCTSFRTTLVAEAGVVMAVVAMEVATGVVARAAEGMAEEAREVAVMAAAVMAAVKAAEAMAAAMVVRGIDGRSRCSPCQVYIARAFHRAVEPTPARCLRKARCSRE